MYKNRNMHGLSADAQINRSRVDAWRKLAVEQPSPSVWRRLMDWFQNAF